MVAAKFKFEGKKISVRKLEKIWRSLTTKTFPNGKIRAFILDNREIERIWREMEGSGRIVAFDDDGNIIPPNENTGATITIVTYPNGTTGWLILIKKNSFCSIEENLKHELNHMINGEIMLDRSINLKRK